MSKNKKSSSFLRLFRYMSHDKTAIVKIIIFLVFSTCLATLAPMIIQHITDSLVTSVSSKSPVDFKYIIKMLSILTALYVISSYCLYRGNKLIGQMAHRTIRNIRQDIHKKLQRLSLNYLDTGQRGDILARATSDIVSLTGTLETNMGQMVTQVTLVVGTVIMMMLNNVLLSLIFILLIPASMLSIRFITKITGKLFKQQQNALGELNAHIEEMTAGHEVMKAFNYEEASAQQLDIMNTRLFKTYLKSRTVSGFINPIVKILNNLVYIAVCVLGGMAIIRGTLTLGGLQAFLIYAQNISTPISQFSVNLNLLQSGLAAARRIFELLDAPEEPPEQPEARLDPKEVLGAVSFKNVKFGYSPDKILMKDVSFQVKPGQVFAIVGPSGAGKTTLVNLLMRFYDIDGGTITLDGNPITDISRENLRECISMVLQDTWIFDGTIAENIGYGKRDASMSEIIAAAVQAQCDQFIRALPDGYDTHISGADSSLSAGEKQLLSIARTVLADPKILILDEATSSIDTRTEVLITSAMNHMMKGRSSFVIAHRLFTIKNADAIIFMKDGDILEVGNHRQLMEKGGYYAELYNSSSD